jgi:hypothetical protein
MKEKGKTMLSFKWILFWYTLEEWAQKVVKINGSLKVRSTLLGNKC